MSRSFLGSLVALAVAGAAATAAAEPPPLVARLEVIPVPSVTLDGAHVLRGEKDGKPVQLGGELRLPAVNAEKFPAVILVHGSGGISAGTLGWADELNGMGIAVFILDSFAGRGIVSTVNDQSQLATLAMMIDLFRAQAILAERPRIDRNRIAVMGFSKGAVAAVYSGMDRFRKLYATTDVGFAAHIGMYTPCDVAYRDDDKVTKKPIRLFHGIADDYVAVGPCRAYIA